ncbi:cullin-1, putative [Entamoeba invadens IP1]|uniref:Cullin-1, putative n=1 Tax=Entamoeba invadens IP1 TaxID=370355 RepID=A0A0A1TYH1_ENTIV|nr:cullin-1, putative [Entamoeba invadens IP1]ELP86519.1 cullin-1, putative [Entamoeba invadens IP1]|eukprot:XP_004185865.1 cullin-1, putative [Entamoeba invadens IP1]
MLHDTWAVFFSNVVSVYGIVESLIEWVNTAIINNTSINSKALSVLKYVSVSLDCSLGVAVFESLENKIDKLFEASVKELENNTSVYGIQVYLFYTKLDNLLQGVPPEFTDKLLKKTLRILVSDQFPLIMDNLKHFWESGDLEGIKNLMKVIKLSNVSADLLNTFNQHEFICCNDFVVKFLKTKDATLRGCFEVVDMKRSYEKTGVKISVLVEVIKNAFIGWAAYQMNGETIVVQLVKYISGLCDNLGKEFNTDDLRKACEVVEIISNKDLFALMYWKNLFSKLTGAKIQNIENELVFIQMFRGVVDSSLSKRIVDLVKDYNMSTGINGKYQKYMNENGQVYDVNFKVQIFGVSQMEDKYISDVKMPTVLTDIFTNFNKFYTSFSFKKKLTILPHFSTCFVNYSSKESNFIMYGNTCQISILLKFNKQDKLTKNEIEDMFSNQQMKESSLSLLLQNGIVEDKGGVIELSKSFTPTTKVTNLLSKKKAETKEIVKKNVQEYEFNKVICFSTKVLKRMKEVSYDELYELVQNEVKPLFVLKINQFKRVVEFLVVKGFATKEENNIIQYVA